MRNTFVSFLCDKKQAGEAEKVCVLTGDLGFSVLEPLQSWGPRFLNCGVAEALMASMAAAFAADGHKVFTYSIAPFATLRCLEQIRNDICYHKLDVTIVGIGAGFGYGTLGPTHHTTEDIAALWSLPHLQVFSPADVWETRSCFELAWTLPGPKYFRLGKGGEGTLPVERAPLKLGEVVEYRAGEALTVVTTGEIVKEVLLATQEMPSIQVLTCPFLKPFPTAALLSRITGKSLVVVEELNPYGGFCSKVCEAVLVSGAARRFDRVVTLSAQDTFASIAGGAAFQRIQTGLGAQQLREAFKVLL